jgi:hypothetical protein
VIGEKFTPAGAALSENDDRADVLSMRRIVARIG